MHQTLLSNIQKRKRSLEPKQHDTKQPIDGTPETQNERRRPTNKQHRTKTTNKAAHIDAKVAKQQPGNQQISTDMNQTQHRETREPPPGEARGKAVRRRRHRPPKPATTHKT
ncbi:hypothetical protein MtrunA17_Chr3g0145481 [Medicago truncatula]|uniref:Uncharacterized protein n=1 Tax=Medicago truncatula TaxID=3880 RepID=G7J8H0_MEDTR|nr:hypothetical protein MTR_3g117730 [Medicago truncatula]RHN71367.1 hypothetical protein MtrunA17_Chr3g0145481 [Medicago truncatula]